MSCGAAGRQETPPCAHGTRPPPARGPAGERWAPQGPLLRAPAPLPALPKRASAGTAARSSSKEPAPSPGPGKGTTPKPPPAKPQLSRAGRGSSSPCPRVATRNPTPWDWCRGGQSQILVPGASAEPGQPWGTPRPVPWSSVSPEAAPWGAQSLWKHKGCTKAASTPQFSSQGSLETPPLLLGGWSCYTLWVPTRGVLGKGWSPTETGSGRKGNKKSFTC